MSERSPNRARSHGLLLSVATLAVSLPVILRIAALVSKRIHLGTSDIRGGLADVGVAILVFCVILGIGSKSRRLASLVMGLWVLLNVLNFVHIRALNSPVALLYAKYALDPVFVNGSISPQHWMLLGVPAAWGLTSIAQKWPRAQVPARRTLWPFLVSAVACLLATFGMSRNPEVLTWRQENVVIINAISLIERWRAPARHRALGQVPQSIKQDLSGRAILGRAVARPNVLLVLVESLSGAFLPTIAGHHGVSSNVNMPNFDAIATRNMTFTTAFAHQRQTNRGEYSVLCGDYPKQRSEVARMSELALGRAKRRCLPIVLKELGYSTTYLQAAPMAFMMKDRFMKRIGFTHQHGAEFFFHAYARNAWGVDDLTFFEGVAGLVKELSQQNAPWFLTALTVGTHHPYLIPERCRTTGSDFAQAVHCADLALEKFVQELAALEVLKNTIVIITADESAGLQQGEDLALQLSQSWVPLVVLAPGAEPGMAISESVAHSDIALSILDYLGQAEKAPDFVGRSIFRRYSTERPLYFANTYLQRLWSLEPKGPQESLLNLCDENLLACQGFLVDKRKPFAKPVSLASVVDSTKDAIRVVTEYSTREIKQRKQADMTVSLVEGNRVAVHPSADGQLVFGGQYLSVDRDTTVDLDLTFSVAAHSKTFVKPWVSLHGGHQDVFAPTVPWLAPGDLVRIEKRWRADERIDKLEAVMSARLLNGNSASLQFDKAELRLSPNSRQTENRGLWQRVTFERAKGGEPVRFLTGEHSAFKFGGCISGPDASGHYSGHCRESYLMFGPDAWAPESSTLRGAVKVRGNRGTQTLWLELMAESGGTELAKSERVKLKAGQETELVLEYRMDVPHSMIEARLRAEETSAASDVEFWDGTLEISQ